MADRRKLREKTVQLPQFDRVAAVRSETFDADSHTVEIVWTTGASVRRYDWWDGTEYDEVLSVDPKAVRLERLNLGAPFLDSHCSYGCDNVLGSVVPDTARLRDGKGTATILLSKAAGVADTVQKIREGVIRNVSVGYWIHKVVKTEADDKTMARWDVVDWEPLEISAVSVPADPGSQIRSAERQQDGKGPALRSCVVVTSSSPASAPKQKANQETRMAPHNNRTAAPKNVKSAAKRLAELEVENKRLADLLAKRDGDDKDDKDDKDERDGDDETEDKSKDKDSDDERDGDDDDKKGDDDEGDDERDAAADEEDDADEEDEKRAAPAKRTALTEAEVRKAAEAAVRADRKRGAAIREIASQFGFPKLGERHANGETTVREFKDLVLDRLAERQKKRGNTTFAAAGTAEHDETSRSGRASPAAARDYEKGAAEARALLGKRA